MPETYEDGKGRKRVKETGQLLSDWLAEKTRSSRVSKKAEIDEEEKKRLEQSKSSNRFSFRKKLDPKRHDFGVEYP